MRPKISVEPDVVRWSLTSLRLRGTLIVLAVSAVLAAAAGPAQAAPIRCSQGHWVGSWIAAPSDATASQPLSNQTLRMIIAPHLAGRVLRIHLSNRFGTSPVTLGPVSVAVRLSGAELEPGTLQNVDFGGSRNVTIAPGADAVSDPVHLSFSAFQALAISIAVPGGVLSPTEHNTARQTNYLSAAGSGDHSADLSSTAFGQTATAWYFLDGLDVQAPSATGAVATFGDSITDGFQGNTTPLTEDSTFVNTNTRYPDDLQRRLLAAQIPLSVLNAGISGNRVLQDGQIPSFGPAAVTRFSTDALAQQGVSDVIVLEGINDIGQTNGLTAQQLIDGYVSLIGQAHRAGLKIQLGTLTPSGGTLIPAYGDAAANQLREQVNAWIRSQKLSDGVIDFDAAVRDPSDPSRLNPPYDGSDHLHFSPAGYKALANAIDLRQLTLPRCTQTRLSFTVTPRTVTAGHPTRLRFHLTAAGNPAGGALIMIDGRRVRTNQAGRANLTLTFHRHETANATAALAGYLPARASITVLRTPVKVAPRGPGHGGKRRDSDGDYDRD